MDNSKKIKELEEELIKLRRDQVEYDELPESYKLADAIHSKTCIHNHTDGCGWHYEGWKNIGSTRLRYIQQAEKALKIADSKTIIKILDAIW